MVNEPLPGQITVRMLIEALQHEDPDALVAWVDVWNSSMNVLHALDTIEGGGPVVKLRGRAIEA